MSESSFPQTSHVAALRQKIEERLAAARLSADVAERGVNHYKCQYRFGIRRDPRRDWCVLAIHFQYAERMLASGNDSDLARIIDQFLHDNFEF